MEKLDYEERLQRLGLMRLDRRRVRCDLLEAFNIVSGLYDLTSDTFCKFDDAGKRGHSKKLFKRRSRLDIRKYMCLQNELSTNGMFCLTVAWNVTTLNDFKTKIKLQSEPETQI